MSDLLHEYDAVKRREYYLRNRKLKGRTKKAALPAVIKKVPPKKTRAQRQRELESRVNQLKARLAQLQVVLREMTEAAQKRSGIDKNTAEKAKSKYKAPSSGDPSSKYSDKTQKQKNDAAKAAKKYREKNDELTDQVTDLSNKIKAIREKIKRLQNNGSVGARKSINK